MTEFRDFKKKIYKLRLIAHKLYTENNYKVEVKMFVCKETVGGQFVYSYIFPSHIDLRKKVYEFTDKKTKENFFITWEQLYKQFWGDLSE